MALLHHWVIFFSIESLWIWAICHTWNQTTWALGIINYDTLFCSFMSVFCTDWDPPAKLINPFTFQILWKNICPILTLWDRVKKSTFKGLKCSSTCTCFCFKWYSNFYILPSSESNFIAMMYELPFDSALISFRWTSLSRMVYLIWIRSENEGEKLKWAALFTKVH